MTVTAPDAAARLPPLLQPPQIAAWPQGTVGPPPLQPPPALPYHHQRVRRLPAHLRRPCSSHIEHAVVHISPRRPDFSCDCVHNGEVRCCGATSKHEQISVLHLQYACNWGMSTPFGSLFQRIAGAMSWPKNYDSPAGMSCRKTLRHAVSSQMGSPGWEGSGFGCGQQMQWQWHHLGPVSAALSVEALLPPGAAAASQFFGYHDQYASSEHAASGLAASTAMVCPRGFAGSGSSLALPTDRKRKSWCSPTQTRTTGHRGHLEHYDCSNRAHPAARSTT